MRIFIKRKKSKGKWRKSEHGRRGERGRERREVESERTRERERERATMFGLSSWIEELSGSSSCISIRHAVDILTRLFAVKTERSWWDPVR